MFRNTQLGFRTACLAALVLFITAVDAEIPLGFLTDERVPDKAKHFNVGGEVVLLSDRIIEVRNFTYAGGAPDPFFWADTNEDGPSKGGFILQEISPTTSCGADTILAPTTDEVVTYRLEFPEGTSIHTVFGGTISLWCRAMFVNLGSLDVPASLPQSLAEDLADTRDRELGCSGSAVDKFDLFDRIVKPIKYLFSKYWLF